MSENRLPYAENVSVADQSRIHELLANNTPDDDLWLQLGISVYGASATGEDPDGKSFFKSQLARIQRAICDDLKIREYVDSPHVGDIVSLAILCTGKLAAIYFDGVDIVAMGILIARMGIRTLCKLGSGDEP